MNHSTSDEVLAASCRRTHFARIALPELQDAKSFHGLRCALPVATSSKPLRGSEFNSLQPVSVKSY